MDATELPLPKEERIDRMLPGPEMDDLLARLLDLPVAAAWSTDDGLAQRDLLPRVEARCHKRGHQTDTELHHDRRTVPRWRAILPDGHMATGSHASVALARAALHHLMEGR